VGHAVHGSSPLASRTFFASELRHGIGSCSVPCPRHRCSWTFLLHHSTAWHCRGLDECQCGPREPPRFGPLPPSPALITCLGLDFQPLRSLPRAPPTKLSLQNQVRIELTYCTSAGLSFYVLPHASDTLSATLTLFRPRLTSQAIDYSVVTSIILPRDQPCHFLFL